METLSSARDFREEFVSEDQSTFTASAQISLQNDPSIAPHYQCPELERSMEEIRDALRIDERAESTKRQVQRLEQEIREKRDRDCDGGLLHPLWFPPLPPFSQPTTSGGILSLATSFCSLVPTSLFPHVLLLS